MIGSKFMGRAHSNAYVNGPRFFDLPMGVEMKQVAAQDEESLKKFAKQWGWESWTTKWRELVKNPEVDLVDVGTPNEMHRDQAIEAFENGKHVVCEKPLANTLPIAREMIKVAKKHKKQKAYVWFNYRRCPAVSLAYQMINSGRLGRILQVRCVYLQDWGGPETPLLWRFKKKHAGSGALGDLVAHSVDLARFLTGDDVKKVNGAVLHTVYKERMLLEGGGTGKSDVDDISLLLASFKSGMVASFEASRLARGYKNHNKIELHGEKGSLRFNLERMTELDFYDAELPAKEQGWSTINVSEAGAGHPYAENWWPAGHNLGYEHTFVNQFADMVNEMGGKKSLVPLPSFEDAYEVQRVLEAAVRSAKEGCDIPLSQVK
ncbi:Gfo/Idh/MocA family oxidoreductase [Planctomycetota bacterium]|nr:Gfo/Idh/MocA family oxidoreductase [Planctomycetota bacterium]